MSGQPDVEGAQRIAELLGRQEALSAEVAAASEQVLALRAAQARLKAAEDAYHATLKEIGRLLEEMDCSSVGNWGFEGRMGWLLFQMRKVILAKAGS